MLSSTIVPALTLASVASAALPATWKVGAKWQLEIQDPVQVSADLTKKLQPDADVWDIDLWHASKNKTIAKGLHDRGKTVICYFNFGAVQPQDCDFPDWLNGGLWTGTWYGDASGDPNDRYCERYQDLKNGKVLDLLKARLRIAVDAGCDGVDPDNIDVYDVDALKISQDQVISVLKNMTDYAHSLTTALGNPLMVGQKNAAPISNRLVEFMDFAVLENCLGEGFCNKFTNYISKSKPVIAIEYPDSLGDDSDKKFGCNRNGIDDADRKKVCNGSQNKTPTGFSEVLKLNFNDFGLNGCTQYCSDTQAVVSDVIGENGGNACDYEFKGDKCTAEYKKNHCC